MVQLVSRECLAACTTDNPEALRSAFDYAVDSSTRAWWMRHENRLQAAAGWRSLPWDSQVLGCPSGSVGGLWAEGCYTEQCHRLETVLKTCIADTEDHDVRFLSARLPEDGLASLHAVEAVGFRIMESFLTFGRQTDGEIPVNGAPDCHIRLAQPDEVEKVAALAYRAFQSFRLRVDPQIPESRARHSRREWVRNGFKGRTEAIYVAESKNRIVGFALLRSKAGTEKVGEIELIAVDPAFHGKGIGKELVAEAIRHYQGKTSEIQVGTQAKNLQAIGLYTRMGFSVIRSELSFHRHSEARA
jgi:ribosomal protein S18 acetylase RimI-like enzyme